LSERRSFLTAAGTTLLGVGLAGFLAYYIAQSALAGKRLVQYDWIPVVCEIVAALGIFFLVLFWTSHRQYRANQRALTGLVTTGLKLTRDVQYGVTLTEDEYLIKHEECRQWRKSVVDRLSSDFPEYMAHFANPSGLAMLDAMFGTGGVDGLRSELDINLNRLGEIMMRL
jgi:hypothetical protein